MHPEPNLKIYCPAGLSSPVRKKLVGWLAAIGRLIPFVFPWSPLVRLTGAVVTGSGVIFARGRLHRLNFRLESARNFQAGDPEQTGLGNLDEGPVCVCLPRSRMLVRYFRVPADSEAEIAAMLPHQLSSELPISLKNFSWVWTSVAQQADGFRLVAVQLARNDSLDDFLAPLIEAGLEIVGLVPEGWAWAHAAGLVRMERGDPDCSRARSVIIRGEAAPYLLVEQSGNFLFDSLLSPSVLEDWEGFVGPGAGSFDWDGPDFAELRKQFQDLHGFPLPRPEVWPDALEADESGETSLFFGASVAAAGIENKRMLVSRGMLKRSRHRVTVRTLAGLGRIALLAAVVWLALGLDADRRTRLILEEMNQRILEESPQVAVLESELQTVLENSRERAGNTQVLRALESLRRNVKSPIYLENMDYVKGRGITLRGGAPSSSDVLEMTETLSRDSLWRGLRVQQLRSEQFNGANRVHFVIQGQLN